MIEPEFLKPIIYFGIANYTSLDCSFISGDSIIQSLANN